MSLNAQLHLALAIVHYLDLRGFTRASYDRLRAGINGDATDQDFDAVVDLLPNSFRHANIRGGLRGLALRTGAEIVF